MGRWVHVESDRLSAAEGWERRLGDRLEVRIRKTLLTLLLCGLLQSSLALADGRTKMAVLDTVIIGELSGNQASQLGPLTDQIRDALKSKISEKDWEMIAPEMLRAYFQFHENLRNCLDDPCIRKLYAFTGAQLIVAPKIIKKNEKYHIELFGFLVLPPGESITLRGGFSSHEEDMAGLKANLPDMTAKLFNALLSSFFPSKAERPDTN